MAEELDIERESDDVAARPGGDGMPLGNEMTPRIAQSQAELGEDGATETAYDDDAAATLVWENYQAWVGWLDENAWLAEWQLVDYLKQSPNFDSNGRGGSNGVARISRFNVAKNSNTMATQIKRGIFADQTPFLLEPRGKLANDDDQETYVDAITEIFNVLSERADLEYNVGLLIDCLVLQGTGIGDMGYEEKECVYKTRKRKKQPENIPMPVGPAAIVNTWASDQFEEVPLTVKETWPYFEYRKLGTTLYDPAWRTPNRPELSAHGKIDIDYPNLQNLQQLRGMDCYKDIPSNDDLKQFFFENPIGDAPPASTTSESMNSNSAVVFHAAGEHEQTNVDPTLRPLMRLKYSTKEKIIEVLCYQGRRKTIRNGDHDLQDFALGVTGNWWSIDNSGYGMGIGRLNAGDQRMDQGVLNEVLKMIGYWMNAPLMYNTADGNEPTQNVVMGLGTLWGINAPDGDIRKAFMYAPKPEIPAEAWKIYQLGKDGGEDLVGANSTTMQGNTGPGSTALKTATGVNRLGNKADDNVAEPISNIEGILVRWYRFLWWIVQTKMPIAEIRQILSKKYADTIIDKIDPEKLISAEFNIKILAGQKLAAKASIQQLIPFMLQLLQQPQLMEFMHQKGKTINFSAIEKIFMRVSELQGAEDIIVDLTPEEMEQVKAMNPAMQKTQTATEIEKVRGANKLQAIDAKGKVDTQVAVVKAAANSAAEKASKRLEGPTQFEEAEARNERNTDLAELQNGIPQGGA
jgi:hypothetical protein